MRQIGFVKATGDGFATVEVSRQSACEGCHANADGNCATCITLGNAKKATAKAVNDLGAAVGDRVVVETPSATVILYAAVVFLLPLCFGIGGYFLASLFTEREAIRYLAVLAGFVIAFLLDYFVFNKRASLRTDVRIIEILQKGSSC